MPIDIALFRDSRERQPSYSSRRQFGCLAIQHAGGTECPVERTTSLIDSQTGFELTMVDELYQSIRERGGLSAFRTIFEARRAHILAEPFGKNSIDRQKRSLNGQQARIIHKIPEDDHLNFLIPGTSLALKTTGLAAAQAAERFEKSGIAARSSATEQFRFALAFQRLQEQLAPEGLFGFIRPMKVYGTLREPQTGPVPPREWLLMEHIDANRNVTNRDIVDNGRLVSGFSPREYPELGALVVDKPTQYREPVPISDLTEVLIMEYPWAADFLGDFGSENLLEVLKPRNENGVVEKEYVIIDPEPLSASR